MTRWVALIVAAAMLLTGLLPAGGHFPADSTDAAVSASEWTLPPAMVEPLSPRAAWLAPLVASSLMAMRIELDSFPVGLPGHSAASPTLLIGSLRNLPLRI